MENIKKKRWNPEERKNEQMQIANGMVGGKKYEN